MACKGPRLAKAILRRVQSQRTFITRFLRLAVNQTTVIKIVEYWHKNRHRLVEQSAESRKRLVHIRQLIFDKCKLIQ